MTKEQNTTFGEWVIRWRWMLLVLIPVLVFVAISGAQFLRYNADYKIFFEKDNAQLLALEQMEKSYSKEEGILFIIAPKDGHVFTPSTLISVEQLTEMAWKLPHASRVESLSNFQHSYAKGDNLFVEDLISETSKLSKEKISDIKRIALNERQLLNRLVSSKGDVTAINVTTMLPGLDPMKETPEVMRYARKIADQIRTDNPNIDIYITGLLALNNAFDEVGQLDMRTIVPASFGVILFGIFLFFLRMTATFTTFVVVAGSIMGAMGLAGWLGITLTSASVAAPTMILTLAVANSIHVLVTYYNNLRTGMNKKSAIVESLRLNLLPIFITSLTTALGFLSMNFSNTPPFHDLGNIVAMGVTISFFLSVILLPVLLSFLPTGKLKQQSMLSKNMEKLGVFIIRRQRQLLIGMTLFVVVLAAFIPRNELDTQFVKYFDTSIPFRVATDFASEKLGGLYQISYSLDSGQPGGVNSPEFMSKVDRFVEWCRQQPEVVNVYTYTDTMKRLNKNMHGDDPAWYRLPEQQNLAAQYLLLYELSLPYGLDLNNQINADKSSTRVNLSLKTLSTNEILDLENRAQIWIGNNIESLQISEGSGPIMMFAHMVTHNVLSMLVSTSVALILISLILIIALRSLKIGLISLVPNLVPAAMAFGIWGIFVGEIGMALSVVIGMTLGIIVDDTVHFLSKYMRARREQSLTSPQAVQYAFTTVGQALWITSLVLIVGFSILGLSSFKGNADMGLLSALIIFFAILADFLLLPPLLMKIDGNQKGESQ